MQFVPRLQQIEVRFEDLTRQLADPALIADAAEYRKAAKARSDIAVVVDKYREWKKAASELDQARGMLQEQDPDLRQMATDEAARLEPELAETVTMQLAERGSQLSNQLWLREIR